MLKVEVLKDRLNKKLGEIRHESDGRLTVYNATGRRLGVYNPKTNETRDSTNKLIGKGNVLSSLLK